MNAVSEKQYLADKVAFYRAHGEYREDREVVGATIRKTVLFNDGASWCEVTEPVVESTRVSVHGVLLDVDVRLYRTEVWDSEDTISRFIYSR